MIYFLQAESGGSIKIGFSKDVSRRQDKLEAYYGRPLTLLATVDGGKDQEREIHRQFKHLRFKNTEQFRPTAELLAFIGCPLLVGANPETVEVMEPCRPSNTRPIRIDLPLDAHRLLRIIAADEDVSMAAFARNCLIAHLKDEAKTRGIKG